MAQARQQVPPGAGGLAVENLQVGAMGAPTDALAFAAQPQPAQVAAEPGAAFPGLAAARIGIPGLQAVELDLAVDTGTVGMAGMQWRKGGGAVGIGRNRDGFARCSGGGSRRAVAHGRVFGRASGLGQRRSRDAGQHEAGGQCVQRAAHARSSTRTSRIMPPSMW